MPSLLLASLKHHHSMFVLGCGTAAHHMAKRTGRISRLLVCHLVPEHCCSSSIPFLSLSSAGELIRLSCLGEPPSISFVPYISFSRNLLKTQIERKPHYRRNAVATAELLAVIYVLHSETAFIGLEWEDRSLTSFKT